MYQTTSEVYGMNWDTTAPFRESMTQSTPYKQLNNTLEPRHYCYRITYTVNITIEIVYVIYVKFVYVTI